MPSVISWDLDFSWLCYVLFFLPPHRGSRRRSFQSQGTDYAGRCIHRRTPVRGEQKYNHRFLPESISRYDIQIKSYHPIYHPSRQHRGSKDETSFTIAVV
jgi:hypothetical protein